MNKITEIVEFLEKNKGYLKWGSERIALKLGCTVEEVDEAKKIIKYSWDKDKVLQDFNEMGLKLEDSIEVVKMPKILILDIETAPIQAYVWRLWKQEVVFMNRWNRFWYGLPKGVKV